MKKKVRSLIWVAGLTSLAIWTVGCMDYTKEAGGGSPQAIEAAKHGHHHQGTPNPVASASSLPSDPADIALSGAWVCAAGDQGCDSSAVKIISEKQGTISTDTTLLVPAVKPQSLCRVHESAQLSVSENADNSEFTGETTDSKIELVTSNENTKDCADILKGTSVAVSNLVYDQAKKVLMIDNVKYTRASSQQAQKMISDHSSTAALTIDSLVGGWSCVEDSCDNDTIEFSTQPLKQVLSSSQPPSQGGSQPSQPAQPTQAPATGIQKIIHKWVMDFSDEKLKCYVSEESAFSSYDQDQTQEEILASLTPSGSRIARHSSENTDMQKCLTAADQWSNTEGPKTHTMSHVAVERDGARKLTLEGKAYISCGGKCPSAP